MNGLGTALFAVCLPPLRTVAKRMEDHMTVQAYLRDMSWAFYVW